MRTTTNPRTGAVTNYAPRFLALLTEDEAHDLRVARARRDTCGACGSGPGEGHHVHCPAITGIGLGQIGDLS